MSSPQQCVQKVSNEDSKAQKVTNAPLQNVSGKKKKIAKYHGVRAHSNPLADKFFFYPTSCENMDWETLFPEVKKGTDKKVENLDIGCGYKIPSFHYISNCYFFFIEFSCHSYGGLTVSLSKTFPAEITLAMEIRER
jgi:hypothetical protein